MKLLKKLFTITPFKISLTITLIFFGISVIYDVNPKEYKFISALADKSLDYKFSMRGPEPVKSKIIIVGGDEKSFQKFGQWPFDRGTVFGGMIEKLCSYSIKTVGLDIVWTDREKVVSTGVQNALTDALGTKASMLDDIMARNSGDALLKKAVEKCGDKLVMGYALFHETNTGDSSDDFQKRVKILTAESKNNLTTIRKGEIKYPRYRMDGSGNISFFHVAHSGQLNVTGITPNNVAQGFFNNDQDDDGNYRTGLLFFRANDSFVPSLTLRMAQKVLNPSDAPPIVTVIPEIPEKGLTQKLALDLLTPDGKVNVPIDLFGQAIVNYRGPNKTFPNVSLADLMDSKDSIEYETAEADGRLTVKKVHKSELFKDAIVLFGMTAVSIYDIRPRPFDATATGVENHATILDNLLNNDFLTRPTMEMLPWLIAGSFILSLLFGVAIAKFGAGFGALFAVGSIAGVLYFDQYVFFNQKGIVFSGHLTALQWLFQYIGITILRYMQEESEKKFIRGAFDKYVSPDMIDQMIKDPSKLSIGGEKKELSIMFSDIRGFTELSERVDVKALTQFLNEYLGAMTDILQSNSGTLDKYIGDAVMGFWGAPIESKEHARLAVKTAVEMMQKLEDLNVEFQKKYGLTIDIGIGINTGPVSVGNFGSSKVFSFTVIGDNVNLASRLEGINKYYGTHVIISETTYEHLKPGEFLTREVDTVKVKGKHKPVKIYEVFPDNVTHARLKSVLPSFNEGLKHYYARQWDKAVTTLEGVLKTHEKDKPSLELIERCKYYSSNPPAQDWDGSWEMHSK